MLDLRSGQDYIFWLALLRGGLVAHGLDEVLATYRKVPGSLSRNKLEAVKRQWRVYRQVEQLGLARSLNYFLFYAFNALRKHSSWGERVRVLHPGRIKEGAAGKGSGDVGGQG